MSCLHLLPCEPGEKAVLQATSLPINVIQNSDNVMHEIEQVSIEPSIKVQGSAAMHRVDVHHQPESVDVRWEMTTLDCSIRDSRYDIQIVHSYSSNPNTS
jgi:hypothetical protein